MLRAVPGQPGSEQHHQHALGCVKLCCALLHKTGAVVVLAAANVLSSGCRFLKTHPMQALFDFIDLQNRDGDIRPGAYTLSTQYPRREFAEGQAGSLAENGLNTKQEAVMLILK